MGAFQKADEKPHAMAVKKMEDLFVDTLKDIYYAEKQILKTLPGMVKKAATVCTVAAAA